MAKLTIAGTGFPADPACWLPLHRFTGMINNLILLTAGTDRADTSAHPTLWNKSTKYEN